MKGRIVLTAALFLSLGALAALAQSGLAPVEKLTVVDAKGRKVGPVLGFDPKLRPVVAFQTSGFLVLLRIERDGFYPGAWLANYVDDPGEAVVGFQSKDCSGPPFLFALSPSPNSDPAQGGIGWDRLLRPGAVSGNLVYVVTADAPERHMLGSLLKEGCQDWGSFGPVYGYAAMTVDWTAQFTPPFKLR